MSKNIKFLILIVLTVFFSIIAWHSLATVFHLKTESGGLPVISVLLKLIYPVLAFCFFLALVSLSAIIIRSEWVLVGIWIITGLPIFLFFPFSLWLLVIILLQSLFFFYYSVRMKNEMKERIRFSLFKIMKMGLGLVVTSVILSISLTYYITTSMEQRDQGKKALDSLVDSAVKVVNQIIPSQVEGYNPNMTLDEFVFQISLGAAENIGEQIQKEISLKLGEEEQTVEQSGLIQEIQRRIESGEIDKNQLPPEVISVIENEGTLTASDIVAVPAIREAFQAEINKARDEFLKNVGIEAKGTDTISNVIAKIVREYAFQFLGPYENFITPLLALSLFFTLTIFNFFFQAIIRLLSLIIFKILLITKFITIKAEQKTVQQLII